MRSFQVFEQYLLSSIGEESLKSVMRYVFQELQVEGGDFPEFARHQIALESNSRRGVYEGQTIYRRV
jgi:hypothetical protein